MRIIKRYELANFVIKVPFWVQKGKKNVLWSKSQCKKVQTYSSSPQHLFLPVAAGDGLLKEIGCLVHSKLSNYPFLPSFPLATVGLWDAHEQTEWVSGCKLLSHVQLFATPRTTQSMEFSKPEHWSGQLFHSPGDLPNPGIKLGSPALQVDSLPTELSGKPHVYTASTAKSHQLCPALCDTIEDSPPGSCSWDSPGKNTGVGCHTTVFKINNQQGPTV